jgi:hypothetical protein
MNDVRALNWRYLVPDEPASFLFLPVDGEALPGATIPNGNGGLEGALQRGPYPAVAAPDLAAWLEGGSEKRPAGLLRRLADAVSPGGWLYVGFPNRLYPTHPAAPGSLRLRSAIRVLRRRGFGEIRAFLPFPDQRCPAYLISTETQAPLRHFLARLVFPYVADQHDAERQQRRIMLMRNVALASPHPIRVLFAPAGAVVARRPG